MTTPATTWQIANRTLQFGPRPLIMGIVNVTPDSFSDGGHYFDPIRAELHALRLVEQGADLLDIGGESTRPGSEAVDAEEEIRRVVPVIRAVCGKTSVPVSVDTSKASVARAAIEAGAAIINDVTGLEGDPEMLDVARQSGAGVCVMHMQGTPRSMQQKPQYDDVVSEVTAYLRERRDRLQAAGINRDRIALDPGIGFGKTVEHNLALLSHCESLHELGGPVLVGHSRKRYIGAVLGDDTRDRTAGTIGTALALARQGVQVIRVHDVQAVSDALTLFMKSGGY